MIRNILFIAFLSGSFVLSSCRDPYFPEVHPSNKQILIVEGFLNIGQEPTKLRLTRSTDIVQLGNQDIWMEFDATVQVEGEDNSIQSLSFLGDGYYGGQLNIIPGNRYRVRIRTWDTSEYLSSYVVAKVTPEIDSIGWRRTNNGVTIHVNTHDDSGTSIYYRWEYDETWEIRTQFFSQYIYENGVVRFRVMPEEDRSTCFKYNSSRNIMLASSARLQSDRIAQFPLVQVPRGDEKLAVRYSIMVRQYVLDKEAYDFYNLMKRNTENIGTIFDPQPSEIRGNFTSLTNPEELVVGYVTAGTVTEKRVFIDSSNLAGWSFYQDCPIKEVTPDSIGYYFGPDGIYMPYGVRQDIPGVVSAYYGSFARCVDCTWRNGSLRRPPYW